MNFKTEEYTIVTVKSHLSAQMSFFEYHETNPGESLSEMIERKKIKNIDRIFKGHIKEVEDW